MLRRSSLVTLAAAASLVLAGAPASAEPEVVDYARFHVDVDCSDVAEGDCPDLYEERAVLTSVQDPATTYSTEYRFGEASFSQVPVGTYTLTVMDSDAAAIEQTVEVTSRERVSIAYRPRPSATVTVAVAHVEGHITEQPELTFIAADGSGRSFRHSGRDTDVPNWQAGTEYLTFTTRAFGSWYILAAADGLVAHELPTYYPASLDLEHATPVAFESSALVSLDLPLRAAGRVSGNLGAMARQFFATPVDVYETDGTFVRSDSAYTDANGDFWLGSFTTGRYLLWFGHRQDADDYPGVVYREGGTAFSLDDATPIDVVEGEVRANVDVDPTRCGTISGRTFGVDGSWRQELHATLGEVYAENIDDPAARRVGRVDPAEPWVIDGLAPGRYRVFQSLHGPGGGREITGRYYAGGDTTDGTVLTIDSCSSTITDVEVDLRVSATTAPSILGDAVVGTTLTADTGAWNQHVTTFAYTWLIDGTPVPGATGATFTPRPGDVGHSVAVRLSASAPGYRVGTATTNSAQVAPRPAPVLVAGPTLSPAPRVGVTVRASTGTWSPSTTNVTYTWLRSGAPISGATGPTYTPTAGDAGKPLSVRVTTSVPGQVAASADAKSSVVAAGTLATRTPTLSGSVAVGKTVAATVPAWAPGASLTYRWLVDGKPVLGATHSTYVPTSSQAGHRLTVAVTGSAAGYTTATVSSASTMIAHGALRHGTVTVKGKVKVGSTLTVASTGWSPKPVLTYQWYSDGKVIKGASSTKLKLTTAQRKHRITVKVTAKKQGYITVSVVSRRTAAVG